MNEEKKIACHVCKKDIPKAAALHAEGEEYVLHFCNIVIIRISFLYSSQIPHHFLQFPLTDIPGGG